MALNLFALRRSALLSTLVNLIVIISVVLPVNAMQSTNTGVPQPIYPLNNAYTTPETDPPLGVPSFSWSTVAGANVYRLQVATDIAFTNPIFMDITTRNTTYTPYSQGHLFSDREWYWRVRVEDPQPVGEWSTISRFTKTWATSGNKPALLFPADGELLSFFDSPTFSWSPVIGATRYRFQIATSQTGFDNPILSVETLSTSHQPNNRLSNGWYYWRVLPLDAIDHVGTASDIRSFNMVYGRFSNVPTLLEPADESFPTYTPTFHWTAIEGAEHYRLEYTSDELCDFSVGTSLDTRQTYYTPTDTFANDFRYCWRVRAESGQAVGDWSQIWHFKKQWYLQPVLLTPTQLYQTGLYPVFSWTPVPGAASYKIEISTSPDFSQIIDQNTTANTSYTPRTYYGSQYYYWRVTPIDGGNKIGLFNDPPYEFISTVESLAPIQVYPMVYYQPNNYGLSNEMSPVEDRTVAYPIFIWHQVMVPTPVGGTFVAPYRIQVDDHPHFIHPEWEYDTENTSATPTSENNFTPQAGISYWWRVCPLENTGGSWSCINNPGTGLPWWSQEWQVRFDPSLSLPPTDPTLPPQLLRPMHGQEVVESMPLLEWWPVEGASQYQVEISRDSAFETYEISKTVDIPAYSPDTLLAQRIRGRTDFGTFYWRVRSNTSVNWSEPWRFQVASQSEWRYTRTAGSIENNLLIGSDPIDADVSTYELTTLNAAQSESYWWFSFNAQTTGTNMTYVFYVDRDHQDGSGGLTPPADRGYSVTTIPAHQPEYAIFVDKINGVVDSANTWVYTWDQLHNNWDYGQRFNVIGGSVYSTPEFIELKVPNGAIGMSQETGSASVMLFSVDTGANTVVDSVPSDPQVPGTGQLSRFSAVSDHMNLINPPNTVSGDPSKIPSILPFYWDWPTGSYPSTPFKGSHLEVHLDEEYSNLVAEVTISSNASYFSENSTSLLSDIVGDNIYYWRVQPKYWLPGSQERFGAWTSGWSFYRLGFVPQNLQTSVDFATPTFSWQMAEGAGTYQLQVATDPNFSSLVINVITPMNSFTPTDTLVQGQYYWRVKIIRYGGIDNDWAEGEPFVLTLPTPDGLTPADGQLVHSAPTFCWNPLIRDDDNGNPVLTAWRYRLQVSQDPNFSITYESIETYNNCWTPTMGYHDGTFYWRVAMLDGSGRSGNYSPAAMFVKQYPITTLISPISGSVPQTPTFIWTPVDGAATYLFEVSLFPTFYPLYDTIETINTQYTPTNLYATDKVYYWRVAIRDRNGRQGPFTDARIIIGDVFPTFMPLISR